jgi:broad specificity phosphatase PhoE
LIRHGESLGNVDDKAYVTTPDWKVPITPKGRNQANKAGETLNSLIDTDEFVFLYYSPYLRTRQTVDEIIKHLKPKQIISSREEPRISEQQFGNFQNVKDVLYAKQERHEFGRFYYRFKSGEAGLDVYSRVSSFISTLLRDCQQYAKAGYDLVRFFWICWFLCMNSN